MQYQQTGGCLCISSCSSSYPRLSPFLTGADTPLPTAVTPLDLQTIPTPVSLARALDPAEVRCASKALERSVEVHVLGMATVLRDSCAQTATGALSNINPNMLTWCSRCQGCSLTSFTCWYDDQCISW